MTVRPSRTMTATNASSETTRSLGEIMMTGILVLQPIGALVAGILILIYPRIYVVAIYLILAGLIGLVPHVMG